MSKPPPGGFLLPREQLFCCRSCGLFLLKNLSK
nr:MAG TPA: hypothetical protein [Caudoviricetes sp.]